MDWGTFALAVPAGPLRAIRRGPGPVPQNYCRPG